MSNTFDPDRTRINVSGYMTHTPLGEVDIGYSLGLIDVRGDFRCLGSADLRRIADTIDAKASATKEQPPPKSEAYDIARLRGLVAAADDWVAANKRIERLERIVLVLADALQNEPALKIGYKELIEPDENWNGPKEAGR